jgi:hypothetical protein
MKKRRWYRYNWCPPLCSSPDLSAPIVPGGNFYSEVLVDLFHLHLYTSIIIVVSLYLNIVCIHVFCWHVAGMWSGFKWTEFKLCTAKKKKDWKFLSLVLEFELRALHLLGRCSTTWAPPPVLTVVPCFIVFTYSDVVIFVHVFVHSTRVQTLGFVWARQALSHLNYGPQPFCFYFVFKWGLPNFPQAGLN